MENEYILAIDHGTQSVRASLFDLQGQPVAKAKLVVEPYFSTQPGWAEQEPEYFWQSLGRVCRMLWETSDIAPEAVKGIALTTQRSTMIIVDKAGKPLRPAILWLDQRRAEGLPPLDKFWQGVFKLIGFEQDMARARAESEANWLRLNQPDLWRQAHKYLQLSGYLNYRLTGRFADALSSQVGYVPFEVKRMGWAKPGNWRWAAFGLEPELMPEIVPSGGIIGYVTPEASAATGIPVGRPVIAAGADKACEVLGLGGIEPHIGCLSYGTSAGFNITTSRYAEAIPLLPPYPAALPGAFNLEILINRGYWLVSWFKNEFAHREQIQAAEQGIEAEELFDELVSQVPPGSMGLMLQPYWMPSFKNQGPEAKGSVIGFGDVHTRAHLYRAILEGLAYALREGKEKVEKRTGIAVTELRVAGGGASSQAALQITADIFGLPVATAHTNETSSLGAAIAGAVGLGYYPDFPTAVKNMTRLRQVLTPNPTNQQLYDQLYHRVYRQMYTRLQPLYDQIQQITGYPQPLA